MRTETSYISYTEANGFAGAKFIMPGTSSWMEFRGYEQDKQKIEGGRLGNPERGRAIGFFCDEECPEDWVDTMGLRIAENDACGLFGFTPVNGFVGVAKMFLQGATTVKSSPAYVFPKAGGAVDERAFEGEDCDGWIEGDSPSKIADSQDFEQVPRVMICAGSDGKLDASRAVLFFHTADNAFSNAQGVWARIAARPKYFQLERFYGVAHGQRAGKFPLFNVKVHVELGAGLLRKCVVRRKG